MTRSILALGALLAATAAWPQPAAAQEAAPGALTALCAARAQESDGFLAQVERARALESEAVAKVALDALEPEARRLAEAAPHDVAAQYRLAAVMGARVDHSHGGDKMEGAAELKEQALRVLALDPHHAGASYMLGRIHASIMRLSGFKRFMAKTLFGGDALEGASWEEAQRLLEAAVKNDPCVADHHFELARLYDHQGNEAGVAREVAYVRELTVDGDSREVRLRRRAEDLLS